MSPEPSASQGAQAQAHEGLIIHLVNVFRLASKELRSIRADPMMLVLVAYTFSVAVYTVATGASRSQGPDGRRRRRGSFRPFLRLLGCAASPTFRFCGVC